MSLDFTSENLRGCLCCKQRLLGLSHKLSHLRRTFSQRLQCHRCNDLYVGVPGVGTPRPSHTAPPSGVQDPQESRTCSVNSMTSGSWLCLMKSNSLSLVMSPSKLFRPSSNCGHREGCENLGPPKASHAARPGPRSPGSARHSNPEL